MTEGPNGVIIHTCSNKVGVDGDCGRVHNDPTTKRVVDNTAKMQYNTHLATKEVKNGSIRKHSKCIRNVSRSC